MAQEEKPTGGERREVKRMEGKKKIAAQVHDSFNSKMQRQIKYLKVLYVVTSVSSTTAQQTQNSSITTPVGFTQYQLNFPGFNAKPPKIEFFI